MEKLLRQNQILSLIHREAIHSQRALRRRLRRLRIDVTQATLSRDLKELHLVRTPSGYKPLPGAPEGTAVATGLALAVRDFLLEVRSAANLLVVKTPAGAAPALAAALDNERWPEIVGTIAGDDTVLVITPTRKSALAIEKRIREAVA
jgi:transcriptional regulator of arginine metabolism